jgi:hypothetical protein
MICADYFSLQGHNYLVVADRFTGWQQVYPAPPGKFDGKSFISFLRDFFATWNIADHLTTDGGPQIMSGEVQTWLAMAWMSSTGPPVPISPTATPGRS